MIRTTHLNAQRYVKRKKVKEAKEQQPDPNRVDKRRRPNTPLVLL